MCMKAVMAFQRRRPASDEHRTGALSVVGMGARTVWLLIACTV
jgi:hypothetical protein